MAWFETNKYIYLLSRFPLHPIQVRPDFDVPFRTLLASPTCFSKQSLLRSLSIRLDSALFLIALTMILFGFIADGELIRKPPFQLLAVSCALCVIFKCLGRDSKLFPSASFFTLLARNLPPLVQTLKSASEFLLDSLPALALEIDGGK